MDYDVQTEQSRPASRRDWRTHLTSALIALVLVLGTAAVRTTSASFTASTVNEGSTWSARTVVLDDDDGGDALFNLVDMWPGQSHETCLNVLYKGGRDGVIQLFANIDGGTGLEQFLELVVEAARTSGSGCDDFAEAEEVYRGRLSEFADLHDGYRTGVGDWVADGGGEPQQRAYRFTVTLEDDNRAQELTALVNFTWQVDGA
jgi:hypothetical protein